MPPAPCTSSPPLATLTPCPRPRSAIRTPNSPLRSPNERTRTHVRSTAFTKRSNAFPSSKFFPRQRTPLPRSTHADARASQCVEHASECVAKVKFFFRPTHWPHHSQLTTHRTPPHVRSRAVPMRWSADPCCIFFRPTARAGAAGLARPVADYTDPASPDHEGGDTSFGAHNRHPIAGRTRYPHGRPRPGAPHRTLPDGRASPTWRTSRGEVRGFLPPPSSLPSPPVQSPHTSPGAAP